MNKYKNEENNNNNTTLNKPFIHDDMEIVFN